MLSYERGFLDPRSEASARLKKLTSNVTAIVLSNAGTSSRDDRGEVSVIGLAGSAPIRFFRALRAAFVEVKRAKKAGESVILSAQDPFVAGKIAFWISRCANVPYEIQEHADYFSGAWERELPVIHEVMAGKGKFFLRRADSVRVVSERIRDRLIRVGVSAERISVIPVAQDVTPLLSREQPASPSEPTIVVPCRFVKQKGLDVLLRALDVLAKEGVAFHLRLIGEGKEGPKLADLASKLSIRDRVTFEQWSSPEEIWKDADLFVLSSRYEGWGRTIVEAMAAGVPIVTTDVGCVGSFFRPQVDGRVVQPNDVTGLASAIREQLTEKDRREWMAKSARERAKEFPKAEALIAQQQEVWREAVNRPSQKWTGRGAWKVTLAIIAFATIVHGLSVALFWPSLGGNREWGFFTLIQHWFQGYGYSFAAQAGCVSAYRSPGFLFFLTAVYGLFGFPNFLAQAIAQNILAVVLAYLVYRLGWRLTDNRWVGWIAALLVTVHPYTFYHYTQYYHTVLSGVFLVGSLLALLALDRTRRLRFAVATGVLVACLAYIQGTILIAMPFIALWLVLRWKEDWKRAIGAVAIIAITSIVLIAPWTIRNWNALHRFVPLTTDLGFAVYKANTENYERVMLAGYPHEALEEEVNPEDPDLVRYHYLPEVQAMLQQSGGITDAAYWTDWHVREVRAADSCSTLPPINEADQNAHWMGLAKEWYGSHLWPDAIRLQAEKALLFWGPALNPSIKYGAPWSFGNTGALATLVRLSLVIYVALLEIFAIIGLVSLIRRKKLGLLIPILMILVAYTFMHTFFAPYTKYRIPLDNIVAVFAALGVIAIVQMLFRRRK